VDLIIDMSGEGSSSQPRQSPYSPFPFGSALGMSSTRTGDQKNSGSSDSTAANGNSTSSGTSTSPNQSSAFGTSIYLKGRVRAQEAYGGPVMFGGHTSSNRKSRMISASPYAASALASRKPHQRPLFDELGSSSSRRGSSAANTPSPAPSPSPSSSSTSDNGVMSSTARLIFDTLEKMSTPVRDAQKLIPSVSCSPPRAEKRRLIAEQFDWCQNSLNKRRRPQLGRSSPAGTLNGPPLRTIFSPVPASPKPRSKAAKSARILSSPAPATSTDFSTSKKSSDIITRDNTNASSSLLGVQAFNLGQSTGSNPIREEKKSSIEQQPAGGSNSASWNTTLLNNWGSSSSSHMPGVPSSIPGGGSGGGKMRAKVSDPMHHSNKPATSKDMLGITTTADPVQNFLAAHNTALPLKDMPVFNFGKSTDPKDTVAISRTSTATTLPLNPSPKRPLDQDLTPLKSVPSITASASYQFSMPSPAGTTSSKSSGSEADAMPNGILFSFCQPKGVVNASTSLPNLAVQPSRPATNFTSKSDISLHKNHTAVATSALPDLTMRSVAKSSPGNNGVSSGGGFMPAKSLKSGSVLDILGKKHSLPDVTASTGINVANTFSNDSVMKKVRGGLFK